MHALLLNFNDKKLNSTENWGLIVFRETTMLYEEGVSPIGHKINVAAVISHEIAHQVGSLDRNLDKIDKKKLILVVRQSCDTFLVVRSVA